MAKKNAAKTHMGKGKFRYRFNHEWLKFDTLQYSWIPNRADVQGLAEDPDTGRLFVTFAETSKGKSPKDCAVLVFDADGKFERRFAPEAHRGGHGIRFLKIGNDNFVFVTSVESCEVYKYIAETGELLTTFKRPKKSDYPGEKFKPTNAVPLPDGRLVVTDGYGMSRVLLYGVDGSFISYFDGSKSGIGALNQPHGITAYGESSILIADRKNLRFVQASIDGRQQTVVKSTEFAFPCNIHQSSDGEMFVVPELWHSVAVCDRNFKVLARLGDGKKKHQCGKVKADSSTEFHNGLVDGSIRELAILPEFFLYPHDAIFTFRHSGKANNILVCEWNEFRRGSGVTLLEHDPE